MEDAHKRNMKRIGKLKLNKKVNGLSRAVIQRDAKDVVEGSNEIVKAFSINMLDVQEMCDKKFKEINDEIKLIKLAMIELKKLCQKKN